MKNCPICGTPTRDNAAYCANPSCNHIYSLPRTPPPPPAPTAPLNPTPTSVPPPLPRTK